MEAGQEVDPAESSIWSSMEQCNLLMAASECWRAETTEYDRLGECTQHGKGETSKPKATCQWPIQCMRDKGYKTIQRGQQFRAVTSTGTGDDRGSQREPGVWEVQRAM